jgi:NAD(P)-dependent dehydrogenase (short-subunit alcohol dehydrogenase family)
VFRQPFRESTILTLQSRTFVSKVTGAGRGIGLKLVQLLSTRPDTVVFAGVRSLPLSPDSDLARRIVELPETIFPVQITSADEADNQEAARYIQEKMGRVDVVIANAGKDNYQAISRRRSELIWSLIVASGTSTGITPIGTVNASNILSDFHVNTLGPLILYQKLASLLSSSAAPGGAKFVVISSALGQIAESLPYSYNAYGISKAAVNYVAKKIDQEDAGVTAFPIQ